MNIVSANNKTASKKDIAKEKAMSDTKIYKGKVMGVDCTAENCKYHSLNQCCAQHIDVKNENALRKAETFCATFEARS